MINISSSNLAKIIEAYKVYFKEYFSIELYKWKAVRCFLAYWDIEAVNFKGMLKQALSKTENLLTSMNNYPRNMLEEFCGHSCISPWQYNHVIQRLWTL